MTGLYLVVRNVVYGGRKELVLGLLRIRFPYPEEQGRGSDLCQSLSSAARCPVPSVQSNSPACNSALSPWIGYTDVCSKTCSITRSVGQPTFALRAITRSNPQPARYPPFICHSSESVVSFTSGGRPQTLSAPSTNNLVRSRIHSSHSSSTYQGTKVRKCP